jgi:DNA-binding response OmpR family regulator
MHGHYGTKSKSKRSPVLIKESANSPGLASSFNPTPTTSVYPGIRIAMNVLLVEDDDAIANPLVAGLERDGFRVIRVGTAAAALEADAPEFVLLDLGLPDADGTDVCRALRSRSEVPIIVLTARADEVDRVVLLELGADDYLVKPFGLRELVARIRAVARRSQPRTDHDASVRVGALAIDRRTRHVHIDSRELTLTPKEFDLLALLASEPGTVHRREAILERVWDEHWYGPTKTLDVHIASLRKKMGDPRWIETVRGVGFRLDEPET